MDSTQQPARSVNSTCLHMSSAIKILCTLLLIAAGSIIALEPAQAAESDTVVINELMYHPGTGNELDEFLELHNYGDAPVDMTGWCFSNGITFCFQPGDSLDPDEFAIISPDSAQTLATYSITPLGVYTGALSNGGETIQLVDEELAIIDTLTYTDDIPWPLSADGGGPSLELNDPLIDNTLPASWSSSLSSGGTPAAVNSVIGIDLPVVSDVTQPQNVENDDTVTVTAVIDNAVTTNLVYKVGFDADVTVSMFDDGSHNDGAASDGVFGAAIPQQASNALVRFRVDAINGNGTASRPSTDDTIDYYGYVVDSQTLNGDVPVLQWFIPDATYDELNGFDEETDTYVSSVFAYGNSVYDNSEIRLKGNYSRTFIKKPYKVKLPQGHFVEIPGISKYPISEFHLNPDFANGNNYLYSTISWKIFEHAGFPVPNFGKLQINKNGLFEGAYLLTDKYDNEWKAENPSYTDQEHYDNWWEKQSPKDNNVAARDLWRAQSLALTGDELKAFILDNNDIPNIINYMAATAVARHHDWSSTQNLQSFLDIDGTGRWSIQPWDLDLTFTNMIWDGVSEISSGSGYMINPRESPDYLPVDDRFMANVIWDDPQLRSMYQRRVRTLVDELWVSGQIPQWGNETADYLDPVMQLDYEKWDGGIDDQEYLDGVLYYMVEVLELDINDPEIIAGFYYQFYGIPDTSILPDPVSAIAPLTLTNKVFSTINIWMTNMTQLFTNEFVAEGYIPESEPANPVIHINEVMYNPSGDNSLEYVELYNPNDYAVDLSQWSIEGIDFELPGGSTLPANGYGIVVKNDAASRAHYGGGVLVLGQYPGSLADSGETISLVRDNDTVSSTLSYAPSEPWPTAANGNGHSLARDIDSGCWGVSSEDDGTPGNANSLDSNWTSSDLSATCGADPQDDSANSGNSETTTIYPAKPTNSDSATGETTDEIESSDSEGKISSKSKAGDLETANEQAIKASAGDTGLPLALSLMIATFVLGCAAVAGLFIVKPRWLMALLGRSSV